MQSNICVMPGRRRNSEVVVAELQPDELNELKKVVGEFMSRLSNVDNEIELLKQDRKELIDEYSSKIDMKTLKLAMKVVSVESSVERKDTYDLFKEVLVDDVTNGLVDD